MSRWFRYYDDALDDPKVQRLSGDLFKAWVNVLSLASKSGGRLPSIDDIAFKLRISVQDAAQRIDDLILAGLIDILPDKSLTPHKWTERQYVSDSSTERMRRHRAKKGDVTVTSQPSQGDAIESESDSEPDTDTEKTSLPTATAKEGKEGFNPDLNGKGSRDIASRLKEIAEGFGLNVPKLVGMATADHIDQPNAYFRGLMLSELRRELPRAPDALLKTAMTKDGAAARKTVYAMLMGVD